MELETDACLWQLHANIRWRRAIQILGRLCLSEPGGADSAGLLALIKVVSATPHNFGHGVRKVLKGYVAEHIPIR